MSKKQQPTIYLPQYFTPEGALKVSMYRLFLDSLHLIKNTPDQSTQQVLFNQVIDLIGLIDSRSVMDEAKKDLMKFLNDNPEIDVKLSRSIESEIIEDDEEEETIEETEEE